MKKSKIATSLTVNDKLIFIASMDVLKSFINMQL